MASQVSSEEPSSEKLIKEGVSEHLALQSKNPAAMSTGIDPGKAFGAVEDPVRKENIDPASRSLDSL